MANETQPKRQEMNRRLMPVLALTLLLGPVALFTRHLTWPLPILCIALLAIPLIILAIRTLLWISHNRTQL